MSFIKDTFFGGAEKKAGRAQAAAAREGAAIIREQFEDVKARLDPFIEPGAPALQQQAALSGALGPDAQREAFAAFQESPGVQFLREQGLRGINTGEAATGGLGGGERLRELTRFSQGLALQDFNAQFNRLGAVTGTGLTAAGNLGGVSGVAAAGQSQALQAAGAAKAGGIVGQAAGRREGIAQVAQVIGGISDIRVKQNIKKTGELDSGLPWYSWEWTEKGRELAGDQPCYGVIAQEAKERFPDAVFYIDGWLHVNYQEIR